MMMSTIPPASIRGEKNSFHGRTSVRKCWKVTEMNIFTATNGKYPSIIRGATLPLGFGSDGQWFVQKRDWAWAARISNQLISSGEARVVTLGTNAMTGMSANYLVLDRASVMVEGLMRDYRATRFLAPQEMEIKSGAIMLWFPGSNYSVTAIDKGCGTVLDVKSNPEAIEHLVSTDLVVIERGQTVVSSYVDDQGKETDNHWSYDGRCVSLNGRPAGETVLWA